VLVLIDGQRLSRPDAYDKTMAGDAGFRMVLTMG
jgi:hypothetical protein